MGSGNIPQQLLDQIIQKDRWRPALHRGTDEQYIERAVANPGHFRARSRQPALLRVPDTLSDALMERLDRVAPSCRLAQIAAVIGREFSFDLLSAVSQIDEERACNRPSRCSNRLTSSIASSISPSVRFAFKHVLLRDAIYDFLLRSKKQQIHADIAVILEQELSGARRKSTRSPGLSLSRSGQSSAGHPLLARLRATRARAFRQC